MDLSKVLLWILVLWFVGYFWAFWVNPVTIKTILTRKGYTKAYVKYFLKERYSIYFYRWIPGFLLR